MSPDANFYVYAYLRPDGRPCYVGKGKGKRWQHRGKCGRNKHFLSIRAQAKAAGLEMPCIKLVEGFTDEQAKQIERDLILLIGREANGGPLVNLTDGGDGASGYKPTPETLAKHSANRKGRTLSPEWCAAISAAMPKTKAPEHVASQAASQRGGTKKSGWWSTEEGRAKQRANNPGHTGHHHSPETKEIIRRATIRQNARRAVITSPAWMIQNAVRYPQPTAVCTGEIR